MVASFKKPIQTVARQNLGTESKLSEISGESSVDHWINSASNEQEPLLQAV